MPHSIVNLVCSNVLAPYIKHYQPCLLGPNWPRPDGNSLYILAVMAFINIRRNTLNKSSLTASIFNMQQYLVFSIRTAANHVPEVGIGHIPGTFAVISS